MRILFLILALLLAGGAPVAAQPFTRDMGFELGISFFGPGGIGQNINGVIELPDKKLIFYGNIKDANFQPSQWGAVRAFADGAIDPTF